MAQQMINGKYFDLTQEEKDDLQARLIIGLEKGDRAAKVKAIKVYGIGLVAVHLPQVDTLEELQLLVKFAPAFQLSAKGQAVRDIVVYMLAKIYQAQTAPIGQVRAYEPTTDSEWPT